MFSEGRCLFVVVEDHEVVVVAEAVAVNVEEDLPPENILHRFADDALAAVGRVGGRAHLQEK